MPNPFVDLIDSGRIRDEEGLKSAFRALAKRTHPDLVPTLGEGEEAGRAFLELRAEYEEALGRLEKKKRPPFRGFEHISKTRDSSFEPPEPSPVAPAPFSRRAFYECFEDLMARGFPRRPELRGPRQGYDSSRGRLLSLLAGRDSVYPADGALTAFYAFERGFAALALAAAKSRERHLAESDTERALKSLVSNIASFHELGFAHLARYAENEWPRLRKGLEEGGERRPIDFLHLLMKDLAKGPAAVD
jgi:hypothetical protein